MDDRFSQYVIKDFNWRLRELNRIVSNLSSAEKEWAETLGRAGFALLYAHWEGHIKETATHYLHTVADQMVTIGDLRREFSLFPADTLFKAMKDGAPRAERHLEALTRIEGIGRMNALILKEYYVDTRANLNADNFREICTKVGVDWRQWCGKRYRIDFKRDHDEIDELCKKRHAIVHGQQVDFDHSSLAGKVDIILDIMRRFRECLENSMDERCYLRC